MASKLVKSFFYCAFRGAKFFSNVKDRLFSTNLITLLLSTQDSIRNLKCQAHALELSVKQRNALVSTSSTPFDEKCVS